MDLYLIRHGDAVPLGEQGIEEDGERPLTEIGHKQARNVGKGLRAKDIKFDKVVTSPLVRARETAEDILKDWPEPRPELIVCEDLVPDGKPKRAARFIRDVKGERIGIVGHMPQLGVMAAWLIGGGKDTQVDLAKAGVAHVTCDTIRKGCGALVWLVPPEWLA